MRNTLDHRRNAVCGMRQCPIRLTAQSPESVPHRRVRRPGLPGGGWRAVLPALLLALCGAGVHAAAPDAQRDPLPQVTAIGVGEVQAAPDIAVIRLAVETTAADAARAGQDNAARMASLRQALERQGIAARDIATTGYSIRVDLRPTERPPKERTAGFVARNGIRVTVRALDRVGATIDAALAGGANQVDEVAFRLADDRALRQKALALAVESARAQAQTMAIAAGGRLGPLIELSAGTGRGDGPQPFAMRAAATPISAGELSVVEQVAARWRFIADAP
jgi:uncharacterized protein